MDQSLYIPLDECDKTDKIVQQIKLNLNDQLIAEMKYIIREYNKTKKNKRSVGKINKTNTNYIPPSLFVDFD